MTRSTIRVLSCGALGDTLLTTPALRALKEEHPSRRLTVYCTTSGQHELYRGNPHIDRLLPPGFRTRCEWQAIQRFGRTRLLKDSYGNLMPSLFYDKPAAEIIGDMLGVRVTDRRLQVFLTEAEEEEATRALEPYRRPVGIHITSRFSANQHWPLDHWARLVQNNPQYTFIQLGLASELVVPGAIDFRGKFTVRGSLAVLKHVQGFVGVVSFFAHATNAVGTPGVVLYGPSTPAIWGHPNNINLTLGLPCAPCVDLLENFACPYRAPCLSGISVEQVEQALHRQMS